MQMWRALAATGMAGVVLAGCASVRPPAGGLGSNGTMRPYQVHGVWYTPRYQPDYDEIGLATWYGPESPNRRTADGEAFAVDIASAAHKTLPLPCFVEVTDLDNGRRIRVRVNDRGPFVAGRIIDLSPRAARDLGIIGRGSERVRVRYIGLAPGAPAGLDVAPSWQTPGDSPPWPQSVAAQAVVPPAPAPTPWVGASAAVPAPAPVAYPSPAAVTYRVRAAAFADRNNADRAVAVLSAQGYAYIETIASGAATLYRVEVDCPAGVAPEIVRQRVVAAGFPGAKVVTAS